MKQIKTIIKETLLDWKHILGWLISAGAILGFLYLFNVGDVRIKLWLYFGLILIPEIIIDIIKHYIKLQ
jgi:hypothetical protein